MSLKTISLQQKRTIPDCLQRLKTGAPNNTCDKLYIAYRPI